jgi:hypothetical protein
MNGKSSTDKMAWEKALGKKRRRRKRRRDDNPPKADVTNRYATEW